MKAIVSFRDLEAWQIAMELARSAHEVAAGLPAVQRYELASQIRRSSVSVPSNIAEGHAHRGVKTFLHHVRIALGSLAELDTQLELALRLRYVDESSLAATLNLLNRAGQILHGLERSLMQRSQRFVSSRLIVVGSIVTLLWYAVT
jgi:carbamoyl-phosphate synthase large subunit